MKEYKYVKDEFDKMKSDRSNWDVMYQVLGEYISQIKQDFQGQPANGEFLTKEIFDSTGTFAAYNSASAMLGMLWPGTAKQSIEISPPDDMKESTALSGFYEKMNNRLVKAMDDPKANLALALDEYMIDQIIFGTSGVGVEKGYESKLLFRPYGVKELYIDEGKSGKIDTCGIFYEWDIKRVVDEYGIDNVSEKTRKHYLAGKKEKIKVLVFIKQRKEKKAQKGKLAMKYESIHLEYDACHLLREEGFHEFPILVVRFRKLTYEKYGRSCAMNALPDIREANALREAIIIATEKNLDPPLGIIDDGMLGGGVVDTSAGAVSVFNASNNTGGSSPVFPLVTVGSLQDALARLEDLKATISQHFNIDRLLDFNNEAQMTFGEAQIRDQIRTASLAGLFSRQIAEGITPIIERSVNILWRDGEFGVVKGSEEEALLTAQGKAVEYLPDEIVNKLKAGEDIYEITYKTKAANASKAEEYIAIIDVLSFSTNAMQVDPSITHRVNLHEGLKKIASIRGLPIGIIRQDDEVDKRIAQEQEQMQQAQMLQSADMAAGAYEKAAKGDAALA